jgi:glycyl-tRNA synthetase beta chain
MDGDRKDQWRAFVYEIGTEEMPARFLMPAIEQFKALLEEALNEAMIEHAGIECYATPRRLVAFSQAMSPVQPEREVKVRGPSAGVAFDESGKPTKAAIGFARSQGVSVDELIIEETERGKFVFAVKRVGGRRTLDVLSEVLPDVTSQLSFPKMMRWGSGGFRFGRPIRWLLALYGDDVIEFELAGLKSDRISRGHRTLCKGLVTLSRAEDYFDAMAKANVIVKHDERRVMIREQVESLANSIGAKPLIREELLDEVTFMTEHPTSVICSFDERYLSLPKEVLETVMIHHQRYFPVVDNGGKGLLPHFIAIRDGGTDWIDTVREGYEKVLQARFADAEFFFREDVKHPLEWYVEKLKGLLFQTGLGSMYEKVQRIKELVLRYCELAGLDEHQKEIALRAAQLCKADLATQMVQELTELEGIIGYEYAIRSGEPPEVAMAIKEHYMPRHANDDMPSTTVGALLGIADRMDTLCACFDRGLIPTGSADPIGLRRAASTIVGVLCYKKLHMKLSSLIDCALEVLKDASLLRSPADETRISLLSFFKGRVDTLLQEEGIDYDIREAVLSAGFDDVFDALVRARTLHKLRRSYDGFNEAVRAFTRVLNILSQHRTDVPFDPELLVEEVEKRLYEEFVAVSNQIPEALSNEEEYADAFIKLSTLKGAIDDFFGTGAGTGVLVIHPDMKLRFNRLSLLQMIESKLLRIADFSKLSI